MKTTQIIEALTHHYDVGGKIVKADERYVVKDNPSLKNLIVSSTDLNPGCATNGHKHDGQEEVYLFIDGNGEMQLDDERFAVSSGDIVLIQDGVFHRVFNTGDEQLYFVCVFEGKRNH